MRILKPDTPAQAIAMMAEAGANARYAAGATALQAEWSLGKPRPDAR